MSKAKGKVTPPPPAKIETKVGKPQKMEYKGSVPRMETPPPTPRGTKK